MELREVGKTTKVMKDVTLSPNSATKYRLDLKKWNFTIPQASTEKALAMIKKSMND